MKLILAVSADDFAARGPDDDMSWTGSEDKRVFRLMTLAAHGPLLAGGPTVAMMPKSLPFRGPIIKLSRKSGLSLEMARKRYPDCWLIGGPTVAEAALQAGYVERVFLCVNEKVLSSGLSIAGIRSHLAETPNQTLRFDGVKVEFWELLRQDGDRGR